MCKIFFQANLYLFILVLMPFVEVGAKSKKTIEFQGSNESLRLLNDVQSVGGSNRPCRDGRSNIELKKLRKSQNTQGRKDSFDRTHPIEKRTTPITKEENDLYALLKSPENARNQLLRSVLEVNSSLLMDYSVPVRTAPICNFGDSDLVRFLIDNGHMKKIGRSSREVIFSCLTWDFEIWKGRRDRLYDYQTSLQLMEKWLKSEPNLEDFEDKFFTIADTYLRRMNSRNDVFDLDEANFYGELLKIGVRQFPILLAKDPNIAEVLLQREAWDVIREAIDNEPKAAFVKIPNRNASIVERAFQANEANREKFWYQLKMRAGFYFEDEGGYFRPFDFFKKWFVYKNFDWAMSHGEILMEYLKADHMLESDVADYYVLNSEELATIYHFPGKTFGNVGNKVESVKSEAPRNLPL
jgi:hypothetical protein